MNYIVKDPRRVTQAITKVPKGDARVIGSDVGPGRISAGNRRSSCPVCPRTTTIILDQKGGNRLCSDCGCVIESSVISEEQEWRNFSNSDDSGGDKSRVGGFTDQWLKDGTGGTGMMGGNSAFKRLGMVHEITTAITGSDRQIKSAFSNLKKLEDFYHLKNSTMERARAWVKDMEEVGELKNKTGMSYMIAVVILCLREEGIIREIKDFIGFDSTISKKDIGKCTNRLKKLAAERKRKTTIGASCAELIPRLCEYLKISRKVGNLASAVVQRSERQDIPTKPQPHVLAAACLLWVIRLCELKIEHQDVAMAARAGLRSIITVINDLQVHSAKIITSDLQSEIQTIKGEATNE